MSTSDAAPDRTAGAPPAESVDEPRPPYGVRPTGFRLPEETTLGRVRLQISDLNRSVSFYTEVLGLRVLRRTEGSAALGTGDGDSTLVELVERKGATAVARRARLGLYHFAILLPDRATLGSFFGHLAKSGTRAGASDHLVSEALYLQDPDGLGIEVYADRPRDSWRSSGRELLMDTTPLDTGSLIRAAAGVPWAGIPSGTVIGHVHLHVGDLAKASDFYHQAVGFDRVVWSYPGALFVSAGGYHHHLGLNTWAGPAAQAPEADEARLLDWEIVLPTTGDVDRVRGSQEGEGYPTRQVDGMLVASDPWGTEVRFRAGPRSALRRP